VAEPATPAEGRTRFPSRLRNRIVVRIGVLVAGLALVLGGSTYVIVSDALEAEKERSAGEQFRTNSTALDAALQAGGDDVDGEALLTSLRPEVRAGELLRSDGEWFSAAARVGPDDLPPALQTGGDDVATARFAADGVSVLGFGTTLSGDRRYVEVFPLDELEATLGTLRRALVASGLVATLAAVVVAWLIARRITAPLESVAHAATRIASGDLDVRMAGTGDRDLGRIAASFNRMADALQARLERESRFAADVSHELRSPMTTLVNAVTVLRHRRSELSGDGREALDLLAGDVERLEHLIADLTEMSKHDAGTIPPATEVLAVGPLLGDLLRRATRPHLPLELVAPAAEALVLVDPDRLERVLRTLLDNADAYAGGPTALVAEVEDRTVRIHLDDDGPGVPEDERERIFDRFARGVHGERRSTADGSGLGLSLALENVRSLGGTLVAGARPDGPGARFTVTLPLVSP
jgi:two-component system, OmpR family, sensor histidine kinase MtrB